MARGGRPVGVLHALGLRRRSRPAAVAHFVASRSCSSPRRARRVVGRGAAVVGPERDVHAGDAGVALGVLLELAGREPQALHPFAEIVLRLLLVDGERDHRLGLDAAVGVALRDDVRAAEGARARRTGSRPGSARRRTCRSARALRSNVSCLPSSAFRYVSKSSSSMRSSLSCDLVRVAAVLALERVRAGRERELRAAARAREGLDEGRASSPGGIQLRPGCPAFAVSGIGGGTFEKSGASSGTSPALVHCGMPFFHTSVLRLTVPGRDLLLQRAMSKGPVCAWPCAT